MLYLCTGAIRKLPTTATYPQVESRTPRPPTSSKPTKNEVLHTGHVAYRIATNFNFTSQFVFKRNQLDGISFYGGVIPFQCEGGERGGYIWSTCLQILTGFRVDNCIHPTSQPLSAALLGSMATTSVLVRIRGFNGEAKDWMVPSDINFRMVLVSVYSHCSNPPTHH